MAKKASEKRAKLFGSIDVLFALDKLDGFLFGQKNMLKESPSSPFSLLMLLLERVGVTQDELIDFLAKYLTGAIPALEIATKAILIAQLKKMVACSIDPMIPDELRIPFKQQQDNNYVSTSDRHGILIDLDSIDLKGKLENISPLEPGADRFYFGVRGSGDKSPINAFQLSRADDFDAFLWFTLHKAKFVNTQFTDELNWKTELESSLKITDFTSNTPLAPFFCKTKIDIGERSKVFVGKSICTKHSSTISICVNSDLSYIKDGEKEYKYYFWPVSMNWESANWYTNSKYYYGYNLGLSKRNFINKEEKDNFQTYGLKLGVENGDVKSLTTKRNYSQEKAIFNVRAIKEINGKQLEQATLEYNNTPLSTRSFVVSILPKPFIHIPTLNFRKKVIENPFRLKRLMFNAKGELDKNGSYSIERSGCTKEIKEDRTVYKLNRSQSRQSKIEIIHKTGEVKLDDNWKQDYHQYIHPCYKGLTVYEFNYDYIMSLKLFDAKNIVSGILNTLGSIGATSGLQLKWSKGGETDEEISEIISNLLEAEDGSYSDCMFKFDNGKYDKQLRSAEDKRKNRYKFGGNDTVQPNIENALKVLDEFDETATLDKQQETIKRAITEASVSRSGEDTNGVDRINPHLKFDFLIMFTQLLSKAFIECILTPKVLMAFQINKQLMGDTSRTPTLRDVLNNLREIIVPIIKTIIESLIQELVDLIIGKLVEVLSKFKRILVQETISAYRQVLADIINNCLIFDWSFLKRTKLNSYLDRVEYADIDPVQEPIVDGNC